MERLRRWIGKLERGAQADKVAIPQRDGTVRRFSVAEMAAAYAGCYELGSSEASPEDKAAALGVLEALKNAAQFRSWHQTYLDAAEMGLELDDIKDMSV
jgi:hypothetical protein